MVGDGVSPATSNRNDGMGSEGATHHMALMAKIVPNRDSIQIMRNERNLNPLLIASK
ncbi:Uncharacterised protein [Actinobacillus pleuropneumoniae]|nr:Uncharacterised protein [Actinobacillus pleuropneumoniae]